MTTVYPGKDPTAPLVFMASAERIAFDLVFVNDSWQSTRFALLKILDQTLDGMFEVLLGDEQKLTDTQAQFVIYVETSEVEKARAIVEYMIGG